MRALWSQVVFFSFLVFQKSKSIWPIQKYINSYLKKLKDLDCKKY